MSSALYLRLLALHSTESYNPNHVIFSLPVSWLKEPSKGHHPTPAQAKIENTRLDGTSEDRQVYTRTRPA